MAPPSDGCYRSPSWPSFLIKLNPNTLVSIHTLLPSQGSFWLTSIFHVDVCSDAAWQKLLTRCSENIRQNTRCLSGRRRRRPESSERLTNPDVESKLRQLPERCYVTAPWADGWTTVLHQRGNVTPPEWPLYVLKSAGCSDGETITSMPERVCESRGRDR